MPNPPQSKQLADTAPPSKQPAPAEAGMSFDIDVSDAFEAPQPADGQDKAGPPPADKQDKARPPVKDEAIDIADFKPKTLSLKDDEPDDEGREPLPQPPEPKPSDAPPGPRQLREAYNTAKAELEALRTEKAEMQAEKERLAQEREQLKARLGEAEKHLTYRDPATHPEVVSLQQAINKELADLPKSSLMTSKQAQALATQAPSLINEFRRIGDPGAEGYDERREAFLTKVHDNFGENGDRVSAVLAKAAQTMEQVERKMAEIKEMGGVNGYQEAKQRHDAIQADYASKYEPGFFNVSPELEEANPYNSKVVIAKLVRSNPKMKAAAEEIKKLIRKAAIPPPPINPRELESLAPAERDQMLRSRMQEHQKIIHHFASQSAEAQLALEIVGPMMRRINELEGQLKLRTSEVPSPRGGAAQAPADERIEVSDFKSQPVSLRG